MAGNHATPAHGGHDAHAGGHHGSLKTYMIGFVLSIILTVIPFWIVMKPTMSQDTIVAIILVLAVIQVVVHLVFFLHLNTSPEERWNLIAFMFTLLIVVIVIGGSVWIMYHIDQNMMTMTPVEN